MAEIFLARVAEPLPNETASGNPVVIKKILPHLSDDPSFLQMFLDEARIAARLAHPGVVRIFDLGQIEESLFLAMEYVHGEDLSSILKESLAAGGPIPPAAAARVLARVAEALHYAHSEQDFEGKPLRVVHRDVTPQNIMVGYAGEVKLLDFGIAKAQGQISRTKPGTVKGKYFYMSPEQCRGKELDGRSDIFSVGVLLYELTTGVRPFQRASEFETLKMIVGEHPEPPSRHVAGYPEPLAKVLSRALAKQKEERYADAGQLARELDAYAHAHPVDLGAWVSSLFPGRVSGQGPANEGRRERTATAVPPPGPAAPPPLVELEAPPGERTELEERSFAPRRAERAAAQQANAEPAFSSTGEAAAAGGPARSGATRLLEDAAVDDERAGRAAEPGRRRGPGIVLLAAIGLILGALGALLARPSSGSPGLREPAPAAAAVAAPVPEPRAFHKTRYEHTARAAEKRPAHKASHPKRRPKRRR